jgi:hypothetical protein
VIVLSNDHVVHGEVCRHMPAEVNDVARVAETVFRAAIEKGGRTPERVVVRFALLAEALEKLALFRGIALSSSLELPMADYVADAFLERLPGKVEFLEGSRPLTWAGWGRPREQTARLFAAAADYYRLAPWKELRDDLHLRTIVPGGGAWSLLMALGEKPAATFFASAQDVEKQFFEGDPLLDNLDLTGVAISITFERKDKLPPMMAEEVRREKWEVAGPMAYPVMRVHWTPGGGITARQMEDVIESLRAVKRFIDHSFDPEREWDDWDPETPYVWTDQIGVLVEVQDLFSDVDVKAEEEERDSAIS